ncbi:MAG TPA: hypothetical protein VKM55_27530 [Candidatus Lokiarchaeia archaeon]|nr:hypothetical protein [Candidatus Lokiarchaeia archaeon]
MTYYLQPGIPHGWDDPRLLESFPHYRNLLDGKTVAFYKIAKTITVPELDGDLSIDDLLQMHADARVKFRDEVAKMQTLEEFEQAAVPSGPSFLDLKIKLAKEYLKSCNFCENQCDVDRTQGQLGECGVPAEACVAWTDIGMGEESILVPSGGLFFYGCTLKCVFCQNFNFSQE